VAVMRSANVSATTTEPLEVEGPNRQRGVAMASW